MRTVPVSALAVLRPFALLALALVVAALLARCGSGGDGGAAAPPGDGGPKPPPAPPPGAPGWAVAAAERFEAALPGGAFAPDPVPDDGPFSDGGAFFASRNVTPPAAFRASTPAGAGGWLTVESYTRRAGASTRDLAEVVPDPADPANHALRITSRAHTDATVLRPSAPLPARYRISVRVGFPSFGDGVAGGLNGYDGPADAGPWWPGEDATRQNGFYWLTILDRLPRPHVNTWIHHHRKVVVDSDNHYPPWMEIWDGGRFVWSGEHPVMLFALDGTQPGAERTGPPFLSYSDGAWQPSGAIRAVDAYLPDTWYRVTIERDGPRYTVEVSGRFRYGGEQTYRATIDAAAACVFHYPVDAAEAAGAARCVDEGAFASVGPAYPRWPAGGVWPDWFMLGDPHVNYYEGSVLYDDLVLETWRD
ncbi:hypothetical protein [Anaeromyxobacter dehalogenans]|uniref:hypothetical protein n=1 Tax=Anaeromyxobacter dehalogenans TaxID=161493 RepID=UPI0002E270B5|nr:hypothetical protein [Anaeromyxobacter dehalogenans]